MVISCTLKKVPGTIRDSIILHYASTYKGLNLFLKTRTSIQRTLEEPSYTKSIAIK